MVIDVDNVILVVDVVLAPVNVGVIAAQSSSLSPSSSSLSSLLSVSSSLLLLLSASTATLTAHHEKKQQNECFVLATPKNSTKYNSLSEIIDGLR